MSGTALLAVSVVMVLNSIFGSVGDEEVDCSMGGDHTLCIYTEYDDQLAKVAHRWAEQCTFQHDKNRKDRRFKHVGQNIAYRGHSDPSFQFPLEQLIVDWYDEVDKFDPSRVKSFESSGGIGHYTQVVWHDTYAVGCGYASYNKNNMKIYQIVCNYAPGGNIIGQEMYEEGTACSSCPSDRSKCSDSLCV